MANRILGDVKYSILNPGRFVNLNGKGWALMDGRNTSAFDSKETKPRNIALYVYTKINND